MFLLTNSTHSKEIGMTIYARQPIAAGDTIYHSYAREFTTTTFRRNRMDPRGRFENLSKLQTREESSLHTLIFWLLWVVFFL